MSADKLRAALKRTDETTIAGNAASVQLLTSVGVVTLASELGHPLTLADLRAAAALDDDPIRTLLKQMMQGWILHEASYYAPPAGDDEHDAIIVGSYSRTMNDCMIEVAGGDKVRGLLLYLFADNSNDIQSIAPHYGLTLAYDADNNLFIREDVPPAPSPDHWWYEGEWRPPEKPDVVPDQ